MSATCHIEPFTSFSESVPTALQAVIDAELLSRQKRIIIKPNLVNSQPPPITLPVECTEALVVALQELTPARIIIAEGAGDRNLETSEIFQRLGYDRLSEQYGVELLDLNHAPLVKLENSACRIFPEMWLPEILFDAFLISVPVLKAHSLAAVTISMKNLIGCAPPSHYQVGQSWKKSAFHTHMHQAIFELNRYRKPDLCLVDASVGMAEYHLGGPTCDPPIGKIIAGLDPVAVDAAGALLLGQDWRNVEHIRWAEGILGNATAGEEASRVDFPLD